MPLCRVRVRSWWTTCDDSIGQTAALLAELERTVCYDPRRVHATGVSNGGVFLYALATSRLAYAPDCSRLPRTPKHSHATLLKRRHSNLS